MKCSRCQAEIPAGKPGCPACESAPPPGARLVLTKAPGDSSDTATHARTMMDMGPSGAPTQAVFSLVKPSTTIGRSSDNDIALSHSTVSKQHVRVFYQDAAFWVEDLGSVNGTRVNDREITRHRLAMNDQIKVGKFTLVFVQSNPRG